LSRVIPGDELDLWLWPWDKATIRPMEKSKLTETKRRDRWRAKTRAWSSFSLTLSWLFTKNSSKQAKQSISYTTVMFYGDCMKICEDLAPNCGCERTGCCITTTHSLTFPFSPGNFWPKTTWLLSSTHPTRPTWPPATFLFPRLKIPLTRLAVFYVG
jgi:hypothetical protein